MRVLGILIYPRLWEVARRLIPLRRGMTRWVVVIRKHSFKR